MSNFTPEQYSYIVDSILKRAHPKGWCCDGINSSTYAKSDLLEIEQRLQAKGYKVLREKRMNSGQRLRGLWIEQGGCLNNEVHD